MKNLIVIPARYASSRFPGKPLVDIGGQSMIQRVYQQACKVSSTSDVIVATDDDRIAEHVASFGGHFMMTSLHHSSGTERCREVADQVKGQYDYLINVQGDEPFINPKQIEKLVAVLDGQVTIATLAKKIDHKEDYESPHVVKVVYNKSGDALYFSRAPIPHVRNNEAAGHQTIQAYKHIGIYAYRTDILQKISELPMSPLEQQEKLEQLRWLENGYQIKVIETDIETFGIDTPQDVEKAIEFLSHQK